VREIRTLRGHQKQVFALAVSPDGKLLVSASLDSTLKLWDLTGERPPITLPGRPGVWRVLAFAPDGKSFVSAVRFIPPDAGGLKTELRLWDPATGKARLTAVMAGIQEGGALTSETLAWGGIDGKVRLWDVVTGQERPPLEAHPGPVLDVKFAHGGKLLVTAGKERMVKVWDIADRKELACYPGEGAPLAISPGGRMLASAGPDDRSIRIRELLGREPVVLKGHTYRPLSLTFSPDGKTLASAIDPFKKEGHFVQETKLWDLATGQERFTLDDAGHPVLFAPDGRALVTAMSKGVQLWEVATGRVRAEYLQGKAVMAIQDDLPLAMALHPNGRALLTAIDKEITLWNTSDRLERMTLTGHEGRPPQLTGLTFLPDGKTLLSAVKDQRSGNKKGELKLWDVANASARKTWNGVGWFQVLSPDGKTLATGTDPRKNVQLWDLDGQPRALLESPGGTAVTAAFSADGQAVIVGTGEGTVTVHDRRTRQILQTLSPSSGLGLSLATSPDGRYLAAVSSLGVLIWEWGSWSQWLHDPKGTAVGFSLDGSLLAVGSREDSQPVIRLLQTGTKTERGVLAGHAGPVKQLIFSRDGQCLASLGEPVDFKSPNDVRLWDVSTGRLRAALKGLPWSTKEVAFSPDGRVVVTIGGDRTVRLWDPLTGQERVALTGHDGEVVALAFSADGHLLATGTFEAKFTIWDATPLITP
jgi:WD40 repeat protein